MPAYFETGFFGDNQPAWHGLGTVIPDDVVTAERAIQLAELDWTVELVPIYAEAPAAPDASDDDFELVCSEDFVAVQRQTDGQILGVTTDKYRPVQNVDAFGFMDDLVDSGDAKYHTAGSLKGGRETWLLARIAKDINVGGMEDEKVATFLFLANSFDKSRALTVGVTPIRVVCANTLQMALRSNRVWKARHREGIDGKIAEARETLGLTFSYLEEFEATANKLITTKMSTNSFKRLLENLIPLPAHDEEQLTERAARNKEEARAAITNLFLNADNLANVRGTAWAAYNAVAEYSDHGLRGRNTARGTLEEHRLARVTQDFRIKDRALELLTAA